MKKLISLAALTLVIACAEESKFKANVTETKVKAKDAEPAKPVLVGKTAELKTTSKAAPIDMVWVIDNSGSMKEEIAQVRQNINSFLKTVGDKSDLSISLLSLEEDARATNEYGLKLDDTSGLKDFMQFKNSVGSWNLFTVLATAMCPADGFKFEADPVVPRRGKILKVCGKDANGMASTDDYMVPAYAGAIEKRLRSNAQKIFVFVTDDNAKGSVTATNFFEITGLDAKKTHIYSFIGHEKKAGCNVTAIGDEYKEISKLTGGETFDICNADWSGSFAKLTENVVSLANNFFELPKEVTTKNVKSVKVDGKDVDKESFLVNNGKLIIADRSLLTATSVVTIEYEVEELPAPTEKEGGKEDTKGPASKG